MIAFTPDLYEKIIYINSPQNSRKMLSVWLHTTVKMGWVRLFNQYEGRRGKVHGRLYQRATSGCCLPIGFWAPLLWIQNLVLKKKEIQNLVLKKERKEGKKENPRMVKRITWAYTFEKQRVWALLTGIFLRNRSLRNAGWFHGKNIINWERKEQAETSKHNVHVVYGR